MNHQTTGFKTNWQGQNCKSLAKYGDDIIRCTLMVFDPDVTKQHHPASRHIFTHHNLSLVLVSTLNDRTIFWLDKNPKLSATAQKFFVQNEHVNVIRTEYSLRFTQNVLYELFFNWCIFLIISGRAKKKRHVHQQLTRKSYPGGINRQCFDDFCLVTLE